MKASTHILRIGIYPLVTKESSTEEIEKVKSIMTKTEKIGNEIGLPIILTGEFKQLLER